MAGEPQITVVGNATSDAELAYTPSGAAKCAFTVAHTPRVKRGDEWTDGETTFYRCTVWREAAESAAETITKGMRLIVHGRFKTRQYEKDGQTRTSIEIDVDEVGPSLRHAVASVKKMQRSGGEQNNSNNRPARGGGSEDPWASAQPPGGGTTSGTFGDEPPFAP